ncbi:MAG TPA: hypothetical protein VKD90_18120 [Gemmataceae bacterium]|nr:hypothetical protein [Gemmataceae bacterium]
MLVFGRIPRGVFPAGGAVALLVLVTAAPAARAGCGDYVTVIRPADHPAHEPSPMPMHPTAPACHGPGCSAAPVPAGAVAPPKAIERPSLDLSADPVAPDVDPPARAALGSDTPRSPTPLAAGIFHPPRAR